MFLCADAVIISKSDLMQVFNFKVTQVKEDLDRLKKDIPLFLLSNEEKTLKILSNFLKENKEKNYVSSHTF